MTVFMLVAVLALSACNSKKQEPHTDSLKRSALMELVFPADPQQPTAKTRQVLMPGDQLKAEPTMQTATVEPLYVVQLDDAHAVMLTQTLPADEAGNAMTCHACSNYIGAYSFTHDERGWRLSKRQDVVASIGVEGSLGKTSILKTERDGKPAFVFAAEWGSCWQGYCGSWLSLIDLTADGAQQAAADIPSGAESSGATGDCEEAPATEPAKASAAPQDASKPAEDDTDQGKRMSAGPCFDVSSKWVLNGTQLSFDFKGVTRNTEEAGKSKSLVKINERTVYEMKDGKFALKSGKNPVPGF
ncbi:hypothetical protein ACO0LO_07070 [Undibacterium sp. TJN25]|uniref:hypothetical protein n=1 Tax=Undibacterium sp. TJN25 TaxID=3413056 RepID=UPI003BF232F8